MNLNFKLESKYLINLILLCNLISNFIIIKDSKQHELKQKYFIEIF